MSIDPSVRLAVIDTTREEIGRVLGPVVEQLKSTLGSIEGKLERIERAERDSDRSHLLAEGRLTSLENSATETKNFITESRDKIGTLSDKQTGISTKVAIGGGLAMLLLNALVTILIFVAKAAIGVP